MKQDWISVRDQKPPVDTEVETKIDDPAGVRNVQTLKLHNGMWWHPDMVMYVYYTPTHWRHLP